MRPFLPSVAVLLIVAAWQERKNKLMFFTAITGLFVCGAAFAATAHQPEWIVISLSIGWLISALIVLWFAINKGLQYLSKRMKRT
jgi:hypothetical protein